MVTDVKPEKQGGVIYLSLNEKIKRAVTGVRSRLGEAGGAQIIMDKLKELYGVTKEQSKMNAYEQFDTFKRSRVVDTNKSVRAVEIETQKQQHAVIYRSSSISIFKEFGTSSREERISTIDR